MLISQELFDETLLESQELFEYPDDQAVEETISELTSGKTNVRLDHLSLTHPESEEGRKDRAAQKTFAEVLEVPDLLKATEILTNADKKHALMYLCLVLTKSVFGVDSKAFELLGSDNDADIEVFIDFVLCLLSKTPISHPLARDLKMQLAKPLSENWFELFDKRPSLDLPLVRWARACCNACEPNKKTFVQAAVKYHYDGTKNGLDLLLNRIPIAQLETDPTDASALAMEICKLLTILGKFQASAEPQPKDGQEPLVSSAHANVKELHKCGAVNRLHALSRQALGMEELLCESLSVLRVMAIDNDIVQNMVAVGILDTINTSLLKPDAISAPLAAATLGLIRNLCANDEIKTSICRRSLPVILNAMECHPKDALVQEHGCGVLAAMALRQPHNAESIVEASGALFILSAMRAFPSKVPLQRQGCLALRNIAVRLMPEQKQVLLDAGVENVLRGAASQHQGSIEEAYAALRDLGCKAVMYKVDENGNAQGTQLFGTVKSKFRPVYD